MSDEAKKARFEWLIGAKVLSGDWDAETAGSVKTKYHFDLLREFFDAGWDWGKEERPAVCLTCYTSTMKEDDAHEA